MKQKKISQSLNTIRLVNLLILISIIIWSNHLFAGNWKDLTEDGLHDPQNPSLYLLQNPGDAMSRLPADSAGNQVDWIRAFNDGYIRPRSSLKENVPVRILDSDILLNKTGSIPRVRFPHKPHTQLLDCQNCHEKLFKSKAGATMISMGQILEGKFCGVCHGAVAFPLTECNRCHSVPWDTMNANEVDKP
jgi:c(7)-type cytochrome triheme protein